MDDKPAHRVLVTDVKMPFLSMVTFMVKWAVAAIPAFLILIFLGALFWSLVVGVFSGLGSRLSGKTAIEAPSSSAPASQSSKTVSSTPAAEAHDPAIAAYIANVSVKNVKVAKTVLDENAVWGEIKNMGDRTLKTVEVTIYCLGQDGKPVFEKQSNPVYVTEHGYGESNQPLKPGYSRQFGVKLDDAPSDWAKKVDVKVTSLEFQ
ncbi:MAG TPA: hypothetical protein VLQ46_00700 [Casimicrobiaceae bacterium]|nr:hypothetical protein [Casimicrobiaceae bacterium]